MDIDLKIAMKLQSCWRSAIEGEIEILKTFSNALAIAHQDFCTGDEQSAKNLVGGLNTIMSDLSAELLGILDTIDSIDLTNGKVCSCVAELLDKISVGKSGS